MEDLITVGSIIVFLIITLFLGIRIIFKPDMSPPRGMRAGNIRRLGVREKNACDLYTDKDVSRSTELSVLIQTQITDDEIQEAFVNIAQQHSILARYIKTSTVDKTKLYFIRMDEEYYDIKRVSSKNWDEEVEKTLRRKNFAEEGPLWSVIYSWKKHEDGYQYNFNLTYHPALLDQSSSACILEMAVDILRSKKIEEKSVTHYLYPSINSLVKTETFSERIMFGAFFLKCVFYSMMPKSFLKSQTISRIKNTFVNLPRHEKSAYEDTDKRTNIRKLMIPIESRNLLNKIAAELNVDVGSLIFGAVNIALASLKDGSVTIVKGAFVEDLRRLPGIKMDKSVLGDYHLETPVFVRVPGWIQNRADTMMTVSQSCQSQLRAGRSRKSYLTQLWEESFTNMVLRPYVNIDKILTACKGRVQTDVIFDFCDVSGSDVVWKSTSLGLGRYGPVVYVSATVLEKTIGVSISYSSAVLTECDIDNLCESLLAVLQ